MNKLEWDEMFKIIAITILIGFLSIVVLAFVVLTIQLLIACIISTNVFLKIIALIGTGLIVGMLMAVFGDELF